MLIRWKSAPYLNCNQIQRETRPAKRVGIARQKGVSRDHQTIDGRIGGQKEKRGVMPRVSLILGGVDDR
jgi:hypothetical protein